MRLIAYLRNYPEFQPDSDILIHALSGYLDLRFDRHFITFQDAAYLKDLCSEIEQMDRRSPCSIFSGHNEQLIYMNFNDRTYADNLVSRLTEDINSHDCAADRMTCPLTACEAKHMSQNKR